MEEGFFIKLQQKLDRLRQNKLFEACVIFVIIFSALVIGAKTFPVGTKYEIFLNILDIAITLFFLLKSLSVSLQTGPLKSSSHKVGMYLILSL